MIRERYFKELAIVLQKEGFTPLPEQEQRLPVAWKGRHLCWITETGGVRYVPQDVNTIEAEHACAKAIDLAAAVQEYAAAMESAPVLEAKGLESGFCLLSEFNNVVLAGHQTQHGTQFITWVWDNNHTHPLILAAIACWTTRGRKRRLPCALDWYRGDSSLTRSR